MMNQIKNLAIRSGKHVKNLCRTTKAASSTVTSKTIEADEIPQELKEISQKSLEMILAEDKYGAHNYHPLPAEYSSKCDRSLWFLFYLGSGE